MSSKTLARARQHPFIAAFITLGAMAAAAVAVAELVGVADRAVISHAELAEIFNVHNSAPHTLAQEQIDLLRKENTCGTIDIQIAILNDVIWRLEQSEPRGRRLAEKRDALEKLKERRTKLTCALLT